MNNWLRNIQGQLSELATEVLQEASVETDDPESLLQAEKRKCVEIERQLVVERSRAEELENRVIELEHQLTFFNEENDAIKEKFERIIASRDLQIKNLQIQINNAEFHRDDPTFHTIDLDEKTFMSAKSSGSAASTSDSTSAQERFAKEEMADLKEKHEAEISALLAAHADSIRQIRQEYEQKFDELKAQGIGWDSGNTTMQFDDEKAASQEAEIVELKAALDAAHDENRRAIEELRAQLLDKEAEVRRLNAAAKMNVNAANVSDDAKPSHVDDDEKRPPSIADSSGSNNGWERMGAEYLGGTAQSSSSSSTSGESHAIKPSHIQENIYEVEAERSKLLEGQLSTLKEQYKSVCAERDKLEDELSNLSGEIETLQKCRRDFEAIQARNARLRADLDAAEAKIDEYVVDLGHELDLKRNLELKISALENRLRLNTEDESTRSSEFNSLKRQIESIQENSDKFAAEAKELRQLIAEHESRVSDDRTRIQQITEEKEHSQSALNAANFALEEYGERFETERQIRERLEAELQFCNIELAEFRARQSTHSEEKSRSEELEQIVADRDRLREEAIKWRNDIAELVTQTANSSARIAELSTENERLRNELSRLHATCDSYSQNLAQLAVEIQAKQRVEEEFVSCRQQLARSVEEQEHTQKELARLREHLLSMEEVSTREAILAEEREVQLREEIRSLQSYSQQFSENANQSKNQYQDEIALLKEQLIASEENCSKVRSLLSEKTAAHAEVTNALANLQQVLRDLGEDQSQEISNYEEQLKRIRKENEELHMLVDSLRERQSSLVEDRRFSEDSVALLKEELERKNAAIEELENQVEDLRHKNDRRGISFSAVRGEGTAQQANTTYKIDDTTLKHLFFSYFIAEKEKQPEIAMVMASILGYSPEEQEAIHAAVSSKSSGGGWFFGLGSGGSRRPGPSQGVSLTEQFIRFLEAESRALSDQPTLHNERDSTTDAQPSVMLTDVTQLPSNSSISRDSYSDLKSIIDK